MGTGLSVKICLEHVKKYYSMKNDEGQNLFLFFPDSNIVTSLGVVACSFISFVECYLELICNSADINASMSIVR